MDSIGDEDYKVGPALGGRQMLSFNCSLIVWQGLPSMCHILLEHRYYVYVCVCVLRNKLVTLDGMVPP